MRFQVLTLTKFKITFLWDVVTTRSVDMNRSFVTLMKKGATTSSETSIFFIIKGVKGSRPGRFQGRHVSVGRHR